MWSLLDNLERSILSFESTVEKEYVVHWRTLYICSSAIHDISSHTKYSFTSSAGCHHAQSISCQITESQTWGDYITSIIDHDYIEK